MVNSIFYTTTTNVSRNSILNSATSTFNLFGLPNVYGCQIAKHKGKGLLNLITSDYRSEKNSNNSDSISNANSNINRFSENSIISSGLSDNSEGGSEKPQNKVKVITRRNKLIAVNAKTRKNILRS